MCIAFRGAKVEQWVWVPLASLIYYKVHPHPFS